MYDITVVTPTLNAEKYIAECLTSVANQKGVRVKHLIVDGGSSDNTQSIVSSFEGVELLIAPKTNIYQANNLGICSANSTYICFLNSDDYYPDEKTLQFSVSLLNNNLSTDVLYGNCEFVDQLGKSLYKQKPICNITFKKALRVLFAVSHPSSFFRLTVFQNYGLYDESIPFASDCEYIIKLLSNKCKFLYINKDLSIFRRHTYNISEVNDASSDWKNIIKKYNGVDSKLYHAIWYLIYNIKNFKYLWYLTKKYI
jgi:glycosyltransferase involved in cell wall biosynthesis